MERLAESPACPSHTGHLDYYLRHGLNPVRYEMSNLAWHLQRRASLYRTMGILPLTIRNARVLEVAAGSGQNSLYVARLRPREFTLVEPNPAGIEDVKALYDKPENAPFRPRLFEVKFQDFHPEGVFDLVICENWLGQSNADRAILRKVGALLAPDGLLSLTTVSPVGFLPNVLRRALAARLAPPDLSFARRTQVLVDAFSSHLARMTAMTRTYVDWIHDNLMNPHYFNVCLTIPMVIDVLGGSLSVVGSSPNFASDWRWFKALFGEHRALNSHFLDEYYANCHSFLDHRVVLPRRDAEANQRVEQAAWRVIEATARFDEVAQSGAAPVAGAGDALLGEVYSVLAALADQPAAFLEPLREFAGLFEKGSINPADVRALSSFSGLFGRETVYVALEKTSEP